MVTFEGGPFRSCAPLSQEPSHRLFLLLERICPFSPTLNHLSVSGRRLICPAGNCPGQRRRYLLVVLMILFPGIFLPTLMNNSVIPKRHHVCYPFFLTHRSGCSVWSVAAFSLSHTPSFRRVYDTPTFFVRNYPFDDRLVHRHPRLSCKMAPFPSSILTLPGNSSPTILPQHFVLLRRI